MTSDAALASEDEIDIGIVTALTYAVDKRTCSMANLEMLQIFCFVKDALVELVKMPDPPNVTRPSDLELAVMQTITAVGLHYRQPFTDEQTKELYFITAKEMLQI